MCAICDKLKVGECLPLLEAQTNLENGYVLSISTCNLYKYESGKVELNLYHDMCGESSVENKLRINYCPLCGRGL